MSNTVQNRIPKVDLVPTRLTKYMADVQSTINQVFAAGAKESKSNTERARLLGVRDTLRKALNDLPVNIPPDTDPPANDLNYGLVVNAEELAQLWPIFVNTAPPRIHTQANGQNGFPMYVLGFRTSKERSQAIRILDAIFDSDTTTWFGTNA